MEYLEEPKEKKTFALSKISTIKNEIANAISSFGEAKANLERAKRDRESLSWYQFRKKHKAQKEIEEARDALANANSDAIMQTFKILGLMLELILFCFLTPMDLIQKTGQWVANGFEERDEQSRRMLGAISSIAEKQKSQTKRLNLKRGFLRIFIVLFIIICLLVTIMFFLKRGHREETITSIPTNSIQNFAAIDEQVFMETKIQEAVDVYMKTNVLDVKIQEAVDAYMKANTLDVDTKIQEAVNTYMKANFTNTTNFPVLNSSITEASVNETQKNIMESNLDNLSNKILDPNQDTDLLQSNEELNLDPTVEIDSGTDADSIITSANSDSSIN